MLRTSTLALFFLCYGCTNGSFLGQDQGLELHSLGPEQLQLHCDSTIAAAMPSTTTEGELWATNIPVPQLESGEFESGQITRMQVLWIPMPGKTPLASTSTNITITQYVFSGDEVGVYIGAGYGWPSGSPEEGLSILMEDATVELQSSSPNFLDLMTPSTMRGHIYAKANPKLARKIAAHARQYSFIEE
jgi:hypothetical protein